MSTPAAVGDSTAKVVNSEQITTLTFSSSFFFFVGDSTAKVVNSEQITTAIRLAIKACWLVNLPQRLLILSKFH